MYIYHIFLNGYGNPSVMPSRPTFSVEGDSIGPNTDKRGMVYSHQSVVKKNGEIVALIPEGAAVEVEDICREERLNHVQALRSLLSDPSVLPISHNSEGLEIVFMPFPNEINAIEVTVKTRTLFFSYPVCVLNKPSFEDKCDIVACEILHKIFAGGVIGFINEVQKHIPKIPD